MKITNKYFFFQMPLSIIQWYDLTENMRAKFVYALPRTENKRQQCSLICGKWNIWAENPILKNGSVDCSNGSLIFAMNQFLVKCIDICIHFVYDQRPICYPIGMVSFYVASRLADKPRNRKYSKQFVHTLQNCCRKTQKAKCALKAFRLHIINSIVYLMFAFNLIIRKII